ncbi:MnhB domain-containing protein [Candidatus Desulfofervidus auxilii]|uniref:MnhB domain-containing protein n=1 Tax=Desulfofervidus auxilii TaxID=1621989 RepID=UPI00082529A4|nr:MnhB domain-containing protein [Candidatus Desulfofervidus auxilii]CAD7778111.1 Na(+)/H(+) antiporter subunit B [Candidatus Methanoperedenaceae archaeon GB50]
MISRWEDIIIETLSRFLVPFMQIYSLYVLAHGHGSPGGGFQGGCIFAASFVLLVIAYDIFEAKKRFSEKINGIFCALGVFIYTAIGWLCLLLGGNFLDYGKLSKILPTDPVMARYYGMAGIETGVQITVMAIMVSIFLDLATAGKHEGALEEEDVGSNS